MQNKHTTISKKYLIWFLVLLLLFCFRVVAQFIQAFYPVDFLPPFEAWQSGALPYWLLVVFQFIIILVCINVVIRFARGKATPSYKAGRIYLALGGVYFSVMLFRLVVGLTFATDHNWFGARIPTVFHLVLASFLLLLGRFHYKYGQIKQ